MSHAGARIARSLNIPVDPDESTATQVYGLIGASAYLDLIIALPSPIPAGTWARILKAINHGTISVEDLAALAVQVEA